MFEIHHVDRIDHPGLAIYASMKRSELHRREGVFVVEGHRVLERLFESRFRVLSCLFPEKWVEHFRPMLEARPEIIPVYVAPLEAMERWTGVTLYQGVLGVAQVPEPMNLENLLTAAASPRLFVAAEGLQSAQNMGVLLRNCVGMGVHGVIVGESSTSPFVRLSVRSSMGTLFKIPILETSSLRETLSALRERGVRCVAADPSRGRTLWDIDFRGETCIVFGNEAEGISPETLALCDDAAGIPMSSGVDSLNVSNAAAVFLYEVNRQRSLM